MHSPVDFVPPNLSEPFIFYFIEFFRPNELKNRTRILVDDDKTILLFKTVSGNFQVYNPLEKLKLSSMYGFNVFL